jgi:exosome complex RNA-binding protein Rrp4
MIVSHTAFMWFCSALIGVVSAAWLVVDVVRLRRALPYSPASHDQVFGSVVGICVALLGLAGVLRFHLG